MLQPLRGRLWQVFLCLDSKREAGQYDQLVQKALGNTKYGRKVRAGRCWRLQHTIRSALETCMLCLGFVQQAGTYRFMTCQDIW